MKVFQHFTFTDLLLKMLKMFALLMLLQALFRAPDFLH
ncbi:hypothetical protein VMA_001441 [Vibrio mimicus VM223]|nr:hypothetical protein VMA_001441 [Vibrio mimicus VM223]